MSKYWVLIGSFSPLITTVQFTTSPPSLSFVSQFKSGTGATWLAQPPNSLTTIYATDETETGSINSLALDPQTGNLTHVASVSTQGGSPTHLGIVNNGTALGAANYGTGSAFVIDLDTTVTGQFSGDSDLIPFEGSGPLQNQGSPHPHQVLQHRDELLVPDLGSDKIWRLVQDGGTWVNKGSIDHAPGSGPRHLVVVDDNVYTIHEMGNTVTQHTISPLASDQPAASLVANVTILPPDLPSNASMAAAELLYAASPTPLLYASNRNLALDPTNIGDGDAITILSTTPSLKTVGYFKTGLAQIRAMAFLGDNQEYILAAGLQGGGIRVYERVDESQGWLKEVASLNDERITVPSAFVWL